MTGNILRVLDTEKSSLNQKSSPQNQMLYKK